MAVLFELTDLAVWLDSDLKTDFATLVRNKVTGLIEAEIGQIPDPVPVGLAAFGVEVAARLYDNPLSYTSESFAGYSAGYGTSGLTADEQRSLRRMGYASRAASVQLSY